MKLFTLSPEGAIKGISAINLAEAKIEPSKGIAQAYKIYPAFMLDAVELIETKGSVSFAGELKEKDREALFLVHQPVGEGQAVYLTSNLITEVEVKGRVTRRTLPFEEAAGMKLLWSDPEKGKFLIRAKPGASFRICRKGPGTGKCPEFTVLWTGQLGGTRGVRMYHRRNRTS